MMDFSQRSTKLEWMDDWDCDGPILKQTLRELKTINRWLGGNRVTTQGIKELLDHAGIRECSLVDIGCGGGDMLRVMDDWGKKEGYAIRLEGVDVNPNSIEQAKIQLKDRPSIQLTIQNVMEENFSDQQVDLVTCTLFTHHFTDSELGSLLQILKQKARIGIIINDLHRHPLAYHSIRLLTRLFSRSPMVRHDAPLSVLRSFRGQDWRRLMQGAGINRYRLRWYWVFRWQVLIWTGSDKGDPVR